GAAAQPAGHVHRAEQPGGAAVRGLRQRGRGAAPGVDGWVDRRGTGDRERGLGHRPRSLLLFGSLGGLGRQRALGGRAGDVSQRLAPQDRAVPGFRRHERRQRARHARGGELAGHASGRQLAVGVGGGGAVRGGGARRARGFYRLGQGRQQEHLHSRGLGERLFWVHQGRRGLAAQRLVGCREPQLRLSGGPGGPVPLGKPRVSGRLLRRQRRPAPQPGRPARRGDGQLPRHREEHRRRGREPDRGRVGAAEPLLRRLRRRPRRARGRREPRRVPRAAEPGRL
ncbi:hypothetical protein H632_c4398p0, partial [Helicosporidium sp. ATCC 50920]